MKIKFSDGMSFNTSGEYRVIHRSDGYYVIGKGTMFPVDSRAEGESEIALLNKIDERNKTEENKNGS